MELLKNDVSFEEKLRAWFNGETPPTVAGRLKAIEVVYESWGRADAGRGCQPRQRERFQFLSKLVFPDDEDIDMMEAMTDHMKMCYMKGYKEGGAAV